MIRIWLPPEPWALRGERVRGLARLRARSERGERIADHHLTGHDKFRARLQRAQHLKCAWCDQRPTRNATVDHFRPKLEATGAGQPGRRTPDGPPTGYWWLTWTPANLVYGCDGCNRAKGTDFPLANGSRRLAPEEQPPGHEVALLIDPSRDDPARHLAFFLDADGKWKPIPRDGDPRGAATLDALKLENDTGYLDQLRRHVERLTPVIERLSTLLHTDETTFAAAWDAEVAPLLAPEAELALLAHDVLAHHFAAPIGAGLVTLERPWNQPPTPIAWDDEDPSLAATLAALTGRVPDAVLDRLAALHLGSPAPEKRAVLADLCAHHPLTTGELAALLTLDATTAADHAAAAGLVEHDGRWRPLPPPTLTVRGGARIPP